MTGIIATLAAAGAAGSGGGTPTTPAWTGIYGVDEASNNQVTMTGYTGQISVSGALSGGGQLYYILNGSYEPYTGAFQVTAGATLAWGISISGRTTRSGNLTVTDNTHSTTLAVIPYIVTGTDS